MSRPKVFAHRGASRRARENSRFAFRLARELEADGVELDVRVSADRALVVVHDEHYGDGRAVATVPVEDRPPDVLLLEEALEECEGLVVNVELKNGTGEAAYDPDAVIADLFAGAVRARAGRDELLVSCFDAVTLARVHQLDASLPTALLTFALEDPATVVRSVAAAGHVALHPFDATVDEALLRAAHDAGLALNVWTVDDPARIRELAQLGVDGICTNVPDVALAVIRRPELPGR